jgi:hypothetical protein
MARGWAGWSPPLRVALIVLAAHAVWIVAFFASGHEIRDFIRIGPRVVTRSDASEVIRFDPSYDYPASRDERYKGTGYDGQYVYFIALDPGQARHYIPPGDDPPYRYGRILYPMLARYAAAAEPDAVPWTMLLINWLAVGVGAGALAAWLARRGSSPWWALLYGLFPGLFISLQRDLTEATAYALVAGAVYLFDYGGRRGTTLAALAFGLAALAREQTLIFPVLFGTSMLAGRPNASDVTGERSPRRLAVFAALSFVPWVLWTVFIVLWLDDFATRGSLLLDAPFVGLFAEPWSPVRQPVNLLFLGVPALVAAGIAVAGLRRGRFRLERLCLLANVVVAVVIASYLQWDSYVPMSRAATGVMISAILCIPAFQQETSGRRRALVLAGALAFAILPAVVAYPFTSFTV